MFLRMLFASLAPDGIVLCGRRKNTRRKRVPKNVILQFCMFGFRGASV